MQTRRDESRPRHVTWTTVEAPAVHNGDALVTPVSRRVMVRCRWGVVFYAWPSAVRVTREGRTSRLRIANATRRIRLAVLATVLVVAWLLVGSSRREK